MSNSEPADETNLLERLRDRGHVEVRRLSQGEVKRLLGCDRYDMVLRGTADEAAAEIKRLRSALEEIDRISPKPGGAGQVARDALRIKP